MFYAITFYCEITRELKDVIVRMFIKFENRTLAPQTFSSPASSKVWGANVLVGANVRESFIKIQRTPNPEPCQDSPVEIPPDPRSDHFLDHPLAE